MKNTTCLLLLPLLLLTGGPGGWPCPGLAHQCPTDVTISEPDDVGIILTEPLVKDSKYLSFTTQLYVRPEPGFKGVTLVVEEPATGAGGDGDACAGGAGAGELHRAWFPLNATRFQGSYEYWEVLVVAKLFPCVAVEVEVSSGECRQACLFTTTLTNLAVLRVFGFGPSAWRHNIPDTRCNTTLKKTAKVNRNLHMSCSLFPSHTTPMSPATITLPATATLPATPTTPVVEARHLIKAESRSMFAGLVGVAVLAVVVVVVTIVYMLAWLRAMLWQRLMQE